MHAGSETRLEIQDQWGRHCLSEHLLSLYTALCSIPSGENKVGRMKRAVKATELRMWV